MATRAVEIPSQYLLLHVPVGLVVEVEVGSDGIPNADTARAVRFAFPTYPAQQALETLDPDHIKVREALAKSNRVLQDEPTSEERQRTKAQRAVEKMPGETREWLLALMQAPEAKRTARRNCTPRPTTSWAFPWLRPSFSGRRTGGPGGTTPRPTA